MLHGFKGFTRWGFFPELSRRIAESGMVAVRFNMSGSGVGSDPESFSEPDAFRVERAPNPHLAFGIGEHFCMGTPLARLELRILFSQLIERLDFAELAGPPARLRATLVQGFKHLPIRYRLRP